MSESKPLTVTHWLVLAAAFLGWMFDGLEMGLFPLAARPALRDLMALPAEAAVAQWYSYLVALFLVGAAAGGWVFGWLGDRIGRVRTMALSIFVYAFFTGCCYFATQPWHLGVFRFSAALGMGGEWALGVALVMEYWPEKLRPLLAGVIGAAANFGFLSISILGVSIAVTETQWRWFMLAGAAPGILAILIILFIPESEKWKAAVKKEVAKPLREIFGTKLWKPAVLGIAFASVAFIGTWGAVSGFLPIWTDQLVGGDRSLKVEVSFRESDQVAIDQAIQAMTQTDNVAFDFDESAPAGSADTAPDLNVRKELSEKLSGGESQGAGGRFEFTTAVANTGTGGAPELTVIDRLPLEVIDPNSVTVSTVREGTSASFDPDTGELRWTIGDLEFKDPYAKAWIQFLLSIGAIVGCFMGPMLGHRLGRRPAYFLLCLGSLISCAYLFRMLDAYNAQFLVVTGIVGLLTASFYGWLPLYLPEIFPTRVRATGQGISFNTGRVLAAAGALTTGQLTGFFGGYPQACATITLVYLVGMVLIWLAPETRGKPLPE